MAELEKIKEKKLKDLIAAKHMKQQNEYMHANKKYFIGSNYEVKKGRAISEIDSNRARLQSLEMREAQLVSTLKESTIRQRSAFNKLEQTVLDGYDYYMKKDKRNKFVIPKKQTAKSTTQSNRDRAYQSIEPIIPEDQALETEIDENTPRNRAPKDSKLNMLQKQNSQLFNFEAGQEPEDF